MNSILVVVTLCFIVYPGLEPPEPLVLENPCFTAIVNISKKADCVSVTRLLLSHLTGMAIETAPGWPYLWKTDCKTGGLKT